MNPWTGWSYFSCIDDTKMLYAISRKVTVIWYLKDLSWMKRRLPRAFHTDISWHLNISQHIHSPYITYRSSMIFVETDLRLRIVKVKGDPQQSSSQPLLVEQKQICCHRVFSGLVQSAHSHLTEVYWLAKGHLADVNINIRPSAREVHCQMLSFRETDSPLWLCLNHVSPQICTLFHQEEGIPRQRTLARPVHCMHFLSGSIFLSCT